jgi:hypothetical protein
MAAELDFDRWREPAQTVVLSLGMEKSGLGQIHLPGHELHPAGLGRRREQTHGRRVAGKRLLGKSVNMDDADAHGRPSISAPREDAKVFAWERFLRDYLQQPAEQQDVFTGCRQQAMASSQQPAPCLQQSAAALQQARALSQQARPF